VDEDLELALLPVLEAFNFFGIPYRVVGSVASSYLGLARATLDVDMVADIRTEQVNVLSAHLSTGFYADAEMMREAIARVSSFNLIHWESAIKLDIFPVGQREYDRVSFARGVTVHLPRGSELVSKTPEDIVLGKLEWFEAGERSSERQWRDIAGLLKVQGERLDLEYMRRWAGELNLTELLERAIREAGI